MALSPITLAVQDWYAATLEVFSRSGVAYLLFASPVSSDSVRQLRWRRHDGKPGDEVASGLTGPFNALAAYVRTDGRLLVVFDDEISPTNPEPYTWSVIFDFNTGEVWRDPMDVAEGARPALVALPGATPPRLALTYRVKRTGQVLVRESLNEGTTWSEARPILNNKVAATTELAAVAFDGTHLALAQVGRDARQLTELGSLTRTRPLAFIAAAGPGQVYVVESSQRDVSGTLQLTDSTRGSLVLRVDGELLVPTRQRQGTDDGIGDLALLDVSGAAPVLVSSRALGGGALGDGVARVATGSGGAVITYVESLLGASRGTAHAVAASSTRLYVGSYTDRATLEGGLNVVQLSNNTRAAASSVGVLPVRAVSVAEPTGGPPVLAVAVTDAGVHKVLLHTEGTALDPALQKSHRMPQRVDRLLLQMTGPQVGRLYVAMTDRLDIYALNGLDQPLQRLGGWDIRARGVFHHLVLTPSGNVVAAMGEGGVAVFSPNGDRMAQLALSGVAASPWKRATAYALGALVRCTDDAPYAPQRRYFKCTTAGTSGTIEPTWGPTGTVSDGTAAWTEQGVLDAVVTAVALESATSRIYAVGLVGGSSSTNGRVYILAAPALL